MAKKRILQIITRSDWAGGQKVLYSLVYGIKKYYNKDFEVEVACGSENGMLLPELEKIGIKYYIVKDLVREISPIKDLKAYFQIKKIIEKGNYDVVHVHSSKAGCLGRLAAKKLGVKNVIYTIHGWWPIEQYEDLKRKLFINAERFAAKYCDKLVFLCERDLRKARSWKIGLEEQYTIIHNAIIPIANIKKGKLRKELNLSADIKIIGNVARLDPPKNPIRFLKVAKEILKERNDVVFVWIGGSIVDDKYGKEVENFLESNEELKKKVYFLPFRKDAIELMADFDVFLLTSDAEGMPLVILEAMNLGIPVISTGVGCMSEIREIKISNCERMLAKYVLELFDNSIIRSNYLNQNYYFKFLKKYVNLYLNQ
ncbi:glycosyl transferase family 1 [Thermosipho melanesiensis]|uniref:Glycosyl transferase, group 1 n=2 Tax=Thermosipho melanesiensis TaxID=46541 RepID=A6LLX3_THEM4|nr:glycosyltransferase [Thermosipho melanesiensis]ABR30924.1 glycosyl transferase, group 1 [Thermosipho melanesiensis BI429]APT74041.1 glycosyl transferase family 1 [Thermosipho melanesiensis]OOC35969.1 glycosyl transferase family 1 [Thermosipho melanesiensis]OOC38108.1 glycosyl transferase family 1 [Thermosipho melanesiensis]OOC38238.1 glycosyl transferase family 1 [Thermosipho melanesiensis]